MNETKKLLGCAIGLLLALSGRAEVRIFIQDTNGVAWLNYQCTAAESVRAFALDVSVDQGQIIAITNFFRGPSTPAATGYGIFPASFRDHLAIDAGTTINWASPDYSPLANVADNPAATLPGLYSGGVTLEFGALWDPTVPGAAPGPTGTLCALQLSQPATVSVVANTVRGGIVSAVPGTILNPVFISAMVGPAVTSASVQNGRMTLLFQGGQLQSAPSINGPWTDTGDFSGNHIESLGTAQTKFYRVRGP